jgi:DNA-binding HxlR family transcriptional regulator
MSDVNSPHDGRSSIFRSVVTGDPPALRDEAVKEMIDRIRDKWSVLVLLSLSDGRQSHRTLTQLVPHVSSRILTLTIHRLIRDGLVNRAVKSAKVLGNEYELTPLGLSLLEPLTALLNWAERHRDTLIAVRTDGNQRMP